jgi:hypothetical protein
MVGVLLAECLELVGRAAVFKAAAGIHVGQHDNLVGAQDLGRLGHEAHAAEGDDIGAGRRCLAAEVEAVADEIGEVLQFRRLVIMRRMIALRSLRSRSISASRSSPFRLAVGAFIGGPLE